MSLSFFSNDTISVVETRRYRSPQFPRSATDILYDSSEMFSGLYIKKICVHFYYKSDRYSIEYLLLSMPFEIGLEKPMSSFGKRAITSDKISVPKPRFLYSERMYAVSTIGITCLSFENISVPR